MGIHPSNLIKGFLVNEDNDKKLFFQFNPEEWYTEHGATYSEIGSPGSAYPTIYYGGRKLERIPLTLYFHGIKNVSSSMSSTQIENFFENLTKPSKVQKNIIKGSNHFISPPLCTFGFGARIFTCVVESSKIIRKMYNEKLKTIQMQVDITLIILRKTKGNISDANKKKIKGNLKGVPEKKRKKKKKSKKEYFVIPKGKKINLEQLAKKYGTTKAKLKKLNKTITKKMDAQHNIKAGTKVRIK